jgi:hypothetical protein
MISQMEIVLVLFDALHKAGVSPNQRQANAVIAAADSIVAELAVPHAPATPGMGLSAWLCCGETGSSSKYLASVLCHEADPSKPPFAPLAHPHDPADFGRCIGLLDAAPELRPHLAALAVGHGPVWAALVSEWPALEATYRQELPTGKAPELYARMKQLIAAAEGGVS